ncbi:unnamed protein product, partial [Ectocarpus sp. 12 AP-2014]
TDWHGRCHAESRKEGDETTPSDGSNFGTTFPSRSTRTHSRHNLLTQADFIRDEQELLAPTSERTMYVNGRSLISSPRSPSSLLPWRILDGIPAPTQANDADDMLYSARSFPPLSLHPDMTGVCTIPRYESRKHNIVRGGRFPNLFA